MIKIIIAGGRDFADYELLCKTVDGVIGTIHDSVTIISGHAAGADSLGEQYAKEHGIPLEVYPADWKKNGKKAGFMRNSVMAEKGDRLIAFWDGMSKGTLDMITKANDAGMVVNITMY